MLQNIIYLLILIAGFPVGMILSRMCFDEVKAWRGRLVLVTIICLIIAFIISTTKFSYDYSFEATIALLFIGITSLTIIWRSYQTQRSKPKSKQKKKHKNKHKSEHKGKHKRK
ncbi:hypothetical protein GOV14_05765 [Candidatus Pacearchaeota archaeon]|nr:hypothetical protein [Candidatus Pacearchaeota archaeon]